jgi:hypothetical protein
LAVVVGSAAVIVAAVAVASVVAIAIVAVAVVVGSADAGNPTTRISALLDVFAGMGRKACSRFFLT